MTRYRHDPEGERLPIKVDSTSNGEFRPQPLQAYEVAAVEMAQRDATENARKLGLGRRAYMISPCAAATALLALNQTARERGRTGGYFDLAPEAGTDEGAAAAVLVGDEFIFDVQNHAVNPNGPWRDAPGSAAMTAQLRRLSPHSATDGEYAYMSFMDGDHYIKDVFLDSDTHTAAMSVNATNHEDEPLQIEDAAAIRTLVERLGQGRRLLLHGKALPNFPGDLDNMVELKERWGVAAWKLYTQLGIAPEHRGYDLDDEAVMTPFVERSRSLGVRIICAHKGLPFVQTSHAQSTCRDVGGAARLYPDMQFLVYHAGYEFKRVEGAYDPANATAGIDALVKSLIENGIAPNSNVYAEMGAVWRVLMRDPEQAAHAWGKLLVHVGEDNVLWGTDCVWAGSPQDQIQGFRAFQISEELQERCGYPALTPALKAKIFGSNAARVYGIDVPVQDDEVSRRRDAYRHDPDPSFVTHGPKTEREFDALRRGKGKEQA